MTSQAWTTALAEVPEMLGPKDGLLLGAELGAALGESDGQELRFALLVRDRGVPCRSRTIDVMWHALRSKLWLAYSSVVDLALH